MTILVSERADAAMRAYLGERHGVDPGLITLCSLDAQRKAWSDDTGTLWEASAEFIYEFGGERYLLEIDEGEATEFLDKLAQCAVELDWHGERWPKTERRA